MASHGENASILLCIGCVAGLYALCLLLHVILPAVVVNGYVCDPDGQKAAKYRLNGLRSLAIVDGVFYLANSRGLIPIGFLSYNFYSITTACNAVGLFCSIVLLSRGLSRPDEEQEPANRCTTIDKPRENKGKQAPTAQELQSFKDRGMLTHFFLGVEFNPRIVVLGVEVDIKMYLYVIGAQLLHLFIIDAALLRCTQVGVSSGEVITALLSGQTLPEGSVAMTTYLSLFSFFLVEYLWFENVHLFTYDLFCEKVAFKLCWGCMVFYPCFYCIGVWPLVFPAAPQTTDITPLSALAIVALFVCGWCLTRGANMQKYWLKREPKGKTFLAGLVRQETVPGSGGRLLCSGWWGLSRHVNYCGEIIQAIALSLPGFLATGSLLPFWYPFYYLALFIPRERDDEAICAKKYGAAWAEYKRRVPYRIFPGLY